MKRRTLRLGLAAAAALLCGAALPAGAVNLYRDDIRLTDDHGAAVTLADWRGRPAVLTMEYSGCRFTCSALVSWLKAAQAAADARGRALDFIVISLDPQNDTPAAWTRYRRSRGLERSNWHFLTAAGRDTPVLARRLGIAYWREEEHIVHDFKLLRVDAAGEVIRSVDSYGADFGRFVE